MLSWLFYSEALNGPVEDIFVFKATLVIQLLEKTAQEGVVRLFVEFERLAVVHVGRHFFRVSLAQKFNGRIDFALLDFLIFFIFVFSTT